MVSGVVPSPPRHAPSVLSRIGFNIPTSRRLSSNVANSRFRAFRESICAQQKVPTNLYEYALGGTRTHEIELYHSRHKDNLLRHRGDLCWIKYRYRYQNMNNHREWTTSTGTETKRELSGRTLPVRVPNVSSNRYPVGILKTYCCNSNLPATRV